MKNKNIIIYIVGGIVVVGIIVALVFAIVKGFDKDNEDTNKKEIKSLVANFYEKDFYVSSQLEDIKDLKDSGISVTLENLEIMTEKELKADCDKEKSYVTIFPTSPFKATDYKIKYHLDCK